jgi:ATP-binding cassette subfamily C protein CydC
LRGLLELLRTVRRHGGPELVRRLLLAGLVATLTDLAGLALLGCATWLIVTAAGQPPLVALGLAIVGVRAFAILKGTGRYAERLAGHDAALRVLARLRTDVFEAMTAEPVLAGADTGDRLARLVSDVDDVQDLLLRCVTPAVVGAVTSALVVLVTLVSLPAAVMPVLLGLVAAGVVLPALAYLTARRAGARLATVRARMLSASLDVTHGAADLLASGGAPAAQADASRWADRVARLEVRTATVASIVTGAGAMLPGLTALGVVLAGTPSVADGSFGGTGLAVLTLLALAQVEAVTPLAAAAIRYAELRGSLGRVLEVLTGPRLPAPALLAAADERVVAPGLVDVALRGVRVRYPNSRLPALDALDLDVPAGRRVAVVGPSGSGKSTLLAVVTGAVRPESGTVTLGGRTPDPETAWRLAGGVLSDAYVFHASIRRNLTLGCAGLSDDELRWALRTAGLPDWADRLADTVGEDGGLISGGERGRLLLARALVLLPPVLLLDEPTEGLDPAAADVVLRAVLAATAGRGVVLVTHRLVGLDAFDEIVVLDDGRVVQRGKHEALRTTQGWYADEYASQVRSTAGYLAVTGG